MRGPFVLVGWPTAPVAGFGATAIRVGRGGDPERTADAAAALAEAALGT